MPVLHAGTAVLQKVEPVDPKGAVLVGFSVIHQTSVGVGLQPYPPSDKDQLSEWLGRIPGPGATLRAGWHYEIVPKIRITAASGDTASIKAFTIDYTAGGVDYATTTQNQIEMPPDGGC